jgi:hypothetical protein
VETAGERSGLQGVVGTEVGRLAVAGGGLGKQAAARRQWVADCTGRQSVGGSGRMAVPAAGVAGMTPPQALPPLSLSSLSLSSLFPLLLPPAFCSFFHFFSSSRLQQQPAILLSLFFFFGFSSAVLLSPLVVLGFLHIYTYMLGLRVFLFCLVVCVCVWGLRMQPRFFQNYFFFIFLYIYIIHIINIIIILYI